MIIPKPKPRIALRILLKIISFTLFLFLLQTNLFAKKISDFQYLPLSQIQVEGIIAAYQYYKNQYPTGTYNLYFDYIQIYNNSDTLILTFSENHFINTGNSIGSLKKNNLNSLEITYSLKLRKITNVIKR